MTFGWPQLVYLMLVALSLGMTIVKHGQRRDPYNAWEHLSGVTLALLILYWGGFFTPH